jgi:pSer/pThr/pTyr-binding forkhead associated (FHA) protein
LPLTETADTVALAMTLHRSSPADLKARIAAERAVGAFLVYRNDAGEQWIVALEAGPAAMTVGRALSCRIAVPWDGEASRVHAQLDLVGDRCTLLDDGLSRNGTFVNEQRVSVLEAGRPEAVPQRC